jgi:CII-binding regulator of phage lambda lysogenization HflD
MANKKISQLDAIGTIDVVQDSIPIVDYSENVTKRTNLANIGQRVLEASSTTNLAEGTNLYFTNTRVYTKVKATLLAGSNTSITFDDALQTITIASQGNVQSVNTKTGAVVLTTTDISEGTNLYYTQARFNSAFTAKSTSDLTEGTNEYFTAARVRAVVLTGLSLATNAVISATDSVLSAFGKLQAQITANLSTLTSHTSNTSNPHATTKAQVGLSDVPNIDTTNASNISSGTLADARLTSAVTKQGNTFNGASQLVQLDASAKLPAVDGSNLTNLNIPPSTGGDLYLFYNY